MRWLGTALVAVLAVGGWAFVLTTDSGPPAPNFAPAVTPTHAPIITPAQQVRHLATLDSVRLNTAWYGQTEVLYFTAQDEGQVMYLDWLRQNPGFTAGLCYPWAGDLMNQCRWMVASQYVNPIFNQYKHGVAFLFDPSKRFIGFWPS